MKIYIITFERSVQRDYNGTWGTPELLSKSNYEVCTSRKKAEKHLEYYKEDENKWEERIFPFTHITRTWVSDGVTKYKFRDTYMIEEWEL